MRKAIFGLLVICYIISIPATLFAREMNSLDLIDIAFEKGEITRSERIIYNLMTLRNRDEFPPQFSNDEKLLDKSATAIVIEAWDANDIICTGPIVVDIDDVVFLIDYIFSGGPSPVCNLF